MQVELFTEYDEPKLLALIEKWNKFYQNRKTKNS
ncbi:e21 [Lactococcus phage bIL170]|uniref:E21 n=1 Tax=Lactococcus phage bIL170 TaxID=2898539 RepID=O80139_9CAUD|nr:e21 [Lactococcus phage bIL170]AAC27217.1 e21 [Lactococcus phage bIL170]